MMEEIGISYKFTKLVDDSLVCKNRPLTHSMPWHRIPPNMHNYGFGTMSMTTTSGFSREGFVIG